MKNSKSHILTLLLVLSLGSIQNSWTMDEEEISSATFNEPSTAPTVSDIEQLHIKEQENAESKSILKRAIDWLTNKISGPKTVTNVGLDTMHDTPTQPDETNTPENHNIALPTPTVTIDSPQRPEQEMSPSTLEGNIKSLFENQAGSKIPRTKLQSELTNITRSAVPEGATYQESKIPFIESAAIIRPLLPKNVILIPIEKPSTQGSQDFATDFQFELVKMDSYDPKLTIEQNAEQIKKAQGLKIQARDTQNNDTRTLAAHIRRYLQENPSKDNLKALLLDNNRGKEGLTQILATPKMQELFNNLTAEELTTITNKQIAAQPKTPMTLMMWYQAKKYFFQFKAEDYQPFLTNKLIIPIETSARNNPESFTFDIINLESKLSELNDPNPDLSKIAHDLKIEQKLKLTTREIENQLSIYLKHAHKPLLITDNISQSLPFWTPIDQPSFKPTDDAASPTVEPKNTAPQSTNINPTQSKVIRIDSPLMSAQNRTTYLIELTESLDEHFKKTATDPNSKILHTIQQYKNIPVSYDQAGRRTLTITPDADGLLDYNWTDNDASKENFSRLDDSYQTTIKNIKAEIRKQVPDNEPIPLSNDVKVIINKNTQAEIVDKIFKQYFETQLFDIQKEKIGEYSQKRAKDEDAYEQQQYEKMTPSTDRQNPFLATEPITLTTATLTTQERQNLVRYLNSKMNELFTPEKMKELQQSNIMNENQQDTFVKTRIKQELRKILPTDKPITLLNGTLVQITQNLQTQLVQEALEHNFTKIIPETELASTKTPWEVFVYQQSE